MSREDEKCSTCGGSGVLDPQGSEYMCPDCNGTGQVHETPEAEKQYDHEHWQCLGCEEKPEAKGGVQNVPTLEEKPEDETENCSDPTCSIVWPYHNHPAKYQKVEGQTPRPHLPGDPMKGYEAYIRAGMPPEGGWGAESPAAQPDNSVSSSRFEEEAEEIVSGAIHEFHARNGVVVINDMTSRAATELSALFQSEIDWLKSQQAAVTYKNDAGHGWAVPIEAFNKLERAGGDS